MKAVIQKVKKCVLYSDGQKYSEIGEGELVLFGVSAEDKIENVNAMAEKLLKLRIFDDENGKTNKSIFDVNGAETIISREISLTVFSFSADLSDEISLSISLTVSCFVTYFRNVFTGCQSEMILVILSLFGL